MTERKDSAEIGRLVYEPTRPKRPCGCPGRPGFVGDDQRRYVGAVWRCARCGRDWTWKQARGTAREGPTYWWAPESTRHQRRREAKAQRRLG